MTTELLPSQPTMLAYYRLKAWPASDDELGIWAEDADALCRLAEAGELTDSSGDSRAWAEAQESAGEPLRARDLALIVERSEVVQVGGRHGPSEAPSSAGSQNVPGIA